MTTITLVDHGILSYNYEADGGSFLTEPQITTAALQAGDFLVVHQAWGDGTRTLTDIQANGTSILANSTGAALAWGSGDSKRMQTFYYEVPADGTVALHGFLDGSSDAHSLSYMAFRADEAGDWAFDVMQTALGVYGTTPITTAAFDTAGQGVIALFAGHNYYNFTYTPDFESDTYLGRSSSNGTDYNDAFYGYRITTGALSGTTCSADLPATGFDSFLGMQAASFVFTPGGGGGPSEPDFTPMFVSSDAFV